MRRPPRRKQGLARLVGSVQWAQQKVDTSMLNTRMTQASRILLWLILVLLAVWITYAGFRGYFSPELLFNFSNAFSC
jgi:hypothetical protein